MVAYDFMWEHNPAKQNQIVDSLSNKEAFNVVYSISKLEIDLIDITRFRVLND